MGAIVTEYLSDKVYSNGEYFESLAVTAPTTVKVLVIGSPMDVGVEVSLVVPPSGVLQLGFRVPAFKTLQFGWELGMHGLITYRT
jgi:hypothetical protein